MYDMHTHTPLVLFLGKTVATAAQSCPSASERRLLHMPPSLLPQSHPDPFQFHRNSAYLSSPGPWGPGSAPATTLRVQSEHLTHRSDRVRVLLTVPQLPLPPGCVLLPGTQASLSPGPSFALLSSLAFPQPTPAVLPSLSFREGPEPLLLLSSSCLDSHLSPLGVPGSISLSSRMRPVVTSSGS